MKIPKSTLLSRLSNESLLAVVPGFVELALEYGIVRRLKHGEIVCRQGERLRELIIPLSGSIKMRAIKGQELTEVGFLRESRSLGLRQILHDESLPYLAEGDGETQILAIPVERFLDHLNDHIEVLHYLKLVVTSAGARAFRDTLQEAGLRPVDICAIFSHIEETPRHFARDEQIPLHEPSLWFIARGHVEAGRRGGKRKPRELAAGAWFGVEALMAPYTYGYEAHSKDRAILHRAPLVAMRTTLERFKLVDLIFRNSQLFSSVRALPAIEKWDPRELPGRPLAREEYRALGHNEVWDKLRFGRKKGNSVADTVLNLACFLPLPVREDAIESALRTQDMSYHLIAQTLEKFGYIVRTVKTDINSLRAAPLPALIGYGNRLAVLIEMRKKEVVLIDPIQGPLEVKNEILAEYWNQEVLTIERSGTEEEEFSPWRLVTSMLSKRSRLVGSLFGLKSLILALSFALPLLAGYTFDALKGGSSWAQLAGLAGLGFMLRAALASLDYLQDLTHAEIHRDLLYDLQRRFFRHVARLKASTKASVGEISVYEHEFSRFVNFCTGTIVNSSFDCLAIVALSVALASFNFWLLFVPLLLFVTLVLTRIAFLRPLRTLYQAHVKNQADQRQMATAYVDGIAAVKASGSERGLVRKFEGLGLAGWRLNLQASRLIQTLEALIKLYSALAVSVSLYVGCKAYFAQLMSIGDVIALNIYMMVLAGHVQALGAQVAELEEIRVSLDKIRELFGRETVEAPKSSSRQVSPALSGHIELKNVSFQFKMQDRPVLNNLSVTIYPRQTVAIVGKSGAGKSTLARLLTGDLEPTRGNIYFDGIDIRSLDNTCRRRDIGLVLQKSELFSGTIADNVAHGDDRPNENRIIHSLRKSASLELVENQYKKLDHFLAEGGVGLSGGEKQRISLARTYYRGARIMILDEATAALDANSEFEVVGRLKEALAERTGILIAHRFSTVQAADRIIVLHEGQVVEDGTHNELMQKNGYYSELFAEQLAQAQVEGW